MVLLSMPLILPFFLLLQPWTILPVTGDFLAPLLSPIFGDVCKQVKCGQGICKASDSSSISYECECSPGWKQIAATSDQYFKFLACVIPNCTLDYSCSKAPSPVQEKENRGNESIFDDKPSAPPPNLSADHSNEANYIVEGDNYWFIFILALLGI